MTVAYPFTRFSELTRTYGLRETLVWMSKRAVAEATLCTREARWSLVRKRLPSEQVILSGTARPWSSLNDLVDHLCHKESSAFLFSIRDKEKQIAQWQASYPHSVAQTLKQAQDICHLHFKLLGTPYDFDHEIDWQIEAVSGRRWPMDYIERIDHWMWSQRIGDYKPIWELNRHQYLATLGKAYWLTGDEKYAEACAAQLLSWIRGNPYRFGINWYSSLEIGIRLIAWGLAFHFFRQSARFIDLAGAAFVKSLYQQASFLREHLTLDWPGRNNHIIGEAAALAYIGALFNEFTAADGWQEMGLHIVEEEIARQTHPDGVNREQATRYHGFVLDFVLLLVILGRGGALRLSPTLEVAAEKMLDYLMYAMTPDGDCPPLGDADDARGFVLSADPVSQAIREALAAGAVLFDRPDLKFAARKFGEGAFWLLGIEGLEAFEAMPAAQPGQTSVAFPQGGHYIIRDDWTSRSDYALLRCGEFGLAGEGYCAHAHCDLLSPILWIGGRPLLVDSGTYTYHGPWRDRFRLTATHNTMMIDGQEQAIPSGPFSWRKVSSAQCETWQGQCVAGSLRSNEIMIRRELSHPQPGEWRLTDSFVGAGDHRLEWTFHFAPGLALQLQGEQVRVVDAAEPGWAVDVLIPQVTIAVQDGWVSQRYGEKTGDQVLYAWWRGTCTPWGISFVWQFRLANRDPANKGAT